MQGKKERPYQRTLFAKEFPGEICRSRFLERAIIRLCDCPIFVCYYGHFGFSQAAMSHLCASLLPVCVVPAFCKVDRFSLASSKGRGDGWVYKHSPSPSICRRRGCGCALGVVGECAGGRQNSG